MPLCGLHDRRKHRKQLWGRRDRHGRIHLIRPDGSGIKPLNARVPEWVDAERIDVEADVDDEAGQTCRAPSDAADRTRYRMPTAADLGWSVQHINLAA